MKKIFWLGIMLLLLVAPASAQRPANAYFGLFIDEARTDWCISGIGFKTMYLVVLPSENDLWCSELSTTVVGSGLRFFAPDWNPDTAEPVMGGIPGDLAQCFVNCHDDWIYVCIVEMVVEDETPKSIEIGPYQTQPYPNALDCYGGEGEAIPFTTFYINGCGPIAVEETSWGAIKSLYE
jgi:hypothetical protein